ncbi:Feruloyl esterase/Carboxylesterase [Chlorociboria aeruginascens]|nr:Feruloyl esterase/Carboxylesterase [Chlorociboria aeruginascens]
MVDIHWLEPAQDILNILNTTILATATLAPKVFAGYSAKPFISTCLAFDPLQYVSNAVLNIQEFIPAGTTVSFPDNDPSCSRPSQIVSVDICRIALEIKTSDRSSVIFENWLPSEWTGRFLTTGNSGIDGCVKYEDVDYGVMHGFSTVGSNNGHNGTGGFAFYHNDDVLEDYVWRSLHTITEAGKNLTGAFYLSPPTKSYYIGCSSGGRQGIKAAEMFPKDFDGIVAGAPAVNFNNMTSWRASFYEKTGPANSTDFIQASIWMGLIHDEVLRQCDTIDGVEDGIIEDPSLCSFRPEALICGAGGSIGADCLSTSQVRIVRKVLSPLYGSSGELVFPSMQPGSEFFAVQKLYSGIPFPYSLDWFRYVVYSNPTYTLSQFSTSDMTAAQSLNPFNVQTYPSDLIPYAKRNSKILIYHGLQDNQITSYSSERFYNHLARGTSLSSTEMDKFLRYFRISGMFHCNSGPGAWMIGQSSSGSTIFNPDENVLAAMVRWVEEGVAPEVIEGTKYVDDLKENGVETKRKHCRYPYRNTYTSGDANLPESWTCIYR